MIGVIDKQCYIMHRIQSYRLFKLLLISCLLQLTTPFNLEILEPDVLEPMVFVSGQLDDYYNASVYEQHFVCTNG